LKRPSHGQLIDSLNHSIKILELIQHYSPELLRRREHDAGRDGYPAQSMGGGGSSGGVSSSTETAALGKAIVDPTGHSIDSIIKIVADIDQQTQIAQAHLLETLKTETEMRGRVSTVAECRTCPAALLGHANGDRNGFCQACYQSLKRWRMTAADPTSIETFAVVRKAELKQEKQPA